MRLAGNLSRNSDVAVKGIRLLSDYDLISSQAQPQHIGWRGKATINIRSRATSGYLAEPGVRELYRDSRRNWLRLRAGALPKRVSEIV